MRYNYQIKKRKRERNKQIKEVLLAVLGLGILLGGFVIAGFTFPY